MKGFYISNGLLDGNVMTLAVIRKAKLSSFSQNTTMSDYRSQKYIVSDASGNMQRADKIYKIDINEKTLCVGITCLPSVFSANLEIEWTNEYGFNIFCSSTIDASKIYVYEFSNDYSTSNDIGLKLFDDNKNVTFNLSTGHLPIYGFSVVGRLPYNNKNTKYVSIVPVYKGNCMSDDDPTVARVMWIDNRDDEYGTSFCRTAISTSYLENAVYKNGGGIYWDAESLYLIDPDEDKTY